MLNADEADAAGSGETKQVQLLSAPMLDLINQGILEKGVPGVKAGRKTIFIREEQKDSGSDIAAGDIVVLDDFGATRGGTVVASKRGTIV